MKEEGKGMRERCVWVRDGQRVREEHIIGKGRREEREWNMDGEMRQ